MSDEFAKRVVKAMEADRHKLKVKKLDEAMLAMCQTKPAFVNGETNMQSDTIGKLATALVNAQAELKGAVKDAANPFYKSKYANLESVWEACREPLTKNGLAVSQTTNCEAAGDILVTTLLHISGEWIQGRYRLTPVKNDPQAVGSAITYARRYALAAIVGVIQTDDDCESAMDRVIDRTPLKSPVSANPVKNSAPSQWSSVGDVLSHGAALDEAAARLGVHTCGACGEQLVRTNPDSGKQQGWYCRNFKNPSAEPHSFIRD